MYVVILHDDDTTLFADTILCLACKFDYENIYYVQMHVQIIYHRIKNNAYSNVWARIFGVTSLIVTSLRVTSY